MITLFRTDYSQIKGNDGNYKWGFKFTNLNVSQLTTVKDLLILDVDCTTTERKERQKQDILDGFVIIITVHFDKSKYLPNITKSEKLQILTTISIYDSNDNLKENTCNYPDNTTL